jgi:aspartate aminotransferase
MTLSTLAKSIAESPTLRLNEEAQQLRERGESVIHLGIGEPKNKAPMTAILSAAAKLTTGDIKYVPTDGMPSLKKAIVRYTEENYDKIVAPENIIVSSGAKQSIYNILYSILNPQDEVIILAPYWVSYPEIVKMCYAKPVIVTPEDGRFTPRIEEIKEALSSATRAIIVNSPNNPSGTVFCDDLIAALVDLSERKNIHLIMDDIYHKLVFDGKRCSRLHVHEQGHRIITLDCRKRCFETLDDRFPNRVDDRARKLVEVMTNVQAQTTSCASPFSQVAAEGALNGLQGVVESLRLTIQNNRDVTMQELESFTGVRCVKPDGTFYCLPDFRAYRNNSVELSDFLLKKAMVVTVPGKEFGMEGHLRLSYAGTVKDMTEGIARIKWALDPNSPNEIYIGDRKCVRDWV